MQGVFRKNDGLLDWYNDTGSAVVCGQVIIVGTIVGVVNGLQGIASGAWGTLSIEGHHDLDKATGAITRGDSVYWDADGNSVSGTAGAGALTTTASGNTLAGFCEIAAASGDAKCRVYLTSAQRTATLGGAVEADSITGSDSTLEIAGDAPATTSSAGGSVAIAGGIGGSASGAGGAVSATGGAGTAASSAGGAASVTGGAGGAAGTGGAASITGGSPASGNAAGGTLTASGGAGSGTGAGGAATTKGGASGSGATGNGGAWTGGGGAALSTNGTGGAATLAGGVATGTGTGGALTLISGASAGASGTAGAVSLDAGAAAGGTGAAVEIGATNATSTKIGTGGSERAAIKGINISGTIAVAVPTIADAETDIVTVDLSAMTFAAAVGDAVIAIPLEALPTDCVFNGAWVSATDTVTISFGTKEGGSGVTGANKNFKFLLIDLT